MNQQQQQQQQQKVQRRRAPVSHAKPIKRMEGLVLGCPKTGKRTLLSRLKGVDPFAMTEEMKNSVNGNANDSNDKEKKEANPSIIIQYKPPSESPTWDRIKLRIRYANNDIVQKENNTRIDFVVVLISPKDSRETTQSCLEGVLAMYLDRSGHRHRKAAGADDDDDKRERDTHSSSDRSTGSMQPFCIAILFNFRDLEKEEKYPAASASRTDLERLVDQTLRSRNVPENKVVVELLETSLLNCYGLDGLHRFIYRTYLQRSQTDIEWQLDVVRNQIQLTNNNNENDKNNNHQADDNNAKAKSMAYDEFLKEIAPKETVQSSQHQSQHSIDSPTKDRQQQKQPGPRRIMKQPQTLRMGKDALEAFLASSSDEEDTNENTKTKAPVSKPVGNNGFSSDDSSDDDSDDDFFYDESGNRRHHTIVQNQKSNPATTAAASRGGDGDRNEGLDDNADDSSSEEKVVREVRSSPKALNDNADDSSSSDVDNEEESIQEVQSPPKALDSNADDSSTSEVDNEEEVFREDNSPPKASSANPKQIEKTELVDEEVTNKACIVSNGTEKKDEIDDDAPKDGSNHEQDVKRDGNNNGGNAREADDETDAVAAPDIANDNDTDDEGFNDNSCQEKICKANDETADVISNRDGFVDKDKTDGDKIVNGENDDDIDIAPTLPLNTDDGSDDSNMIVSTSVVEKAVQDNDDSGDDYIISSNSVIGRVVQDNDNDDDDDDDGFMISSTPVVKNDAQDDDDDDDYMISSTPAGENVVEHNDDDDDDGYIISSTPPVKNVAQDENEDKDNDDDDDDNGYMISSTPAVGKVVEDDDDDDKFMIGNMLANEDDEMKEDDDSIGFVQSSPIEDGDETNTEAFSPTRLPKNQSIERSYSGSTVENEGKKVDSSSKIDEINSTSQQEPASQSPLAATQQRASNSNPPPQPSTKPVASGGISQAAIAAIAAAQQEAEAMMRQQQQQQRQEQQYSQIPSPTTTKERKSKKKKKDEKKKKKKKKTKGTDDE
jgi:hypothetical protein